MGKGLGKTMQVTSVFLFMLGLEPVVGKSHIPYDVGLV